MVIYKKYLLTKELFYHFKITVGWYTQVMAFYSDLSLAILHTTCAYSYRLRHEQFIYRSEIKLCL